MTTDDGRLDEAYERLHAKGPEFDGWLSNHGPMAVDALLRLGHGDAVHRWVVGYERRLEPAPGVRWPIPPEDWRDPLGDPSRLGDWLALFAREVHQEPWQQVLSRWWPRLLPGAVASSTHGLIRTGHAVRALQGHVTTARLDELGQALGYWAARWEPLPTAGGAGGPLGTAAALASLPAVGDGRPGGARARLGAVAADEAWVSGVARARRPTSAAEVPTALDELTDAAVDRYPHWADAAPVMLVHSATAPRAAALVLPSLPVGLWQATYDMAWTLSAAIVSAYRPPTPAPGHGRPEATSTTTATIPELVAHHDDEHVIKLAEVALEAQRRGSTAAVSAVQRATALIGGSGSR